MVVAPGGSDAEETSPLARQENGATRPGSARVLRVKGPASPYDPTYHLLLNTRKIRAIIAREKPDVLEIHSPYMAAVGALRSQGFGVRTFQWHSDFIDTYGGVLEGRLPFLPGGLVRSATAPLWTLVRSIAKRCSAMLVASAWQVGKLTARGVPNVVHRPFGIERDVFRPDLRSASLRARWIDGRSAETAVLVGVGRFAIEKRWDVVLDAFLRVRQRRPAMLVLFGDGPERERMRLRAGGSPDILFPGFTRDRGVLAEALASADALVHGCPFETFGLSIAEAMSCGLPAVVPDDGGAAEMHGPENGEAYASGDADACAAAIERLLDRDRNDLRAGAIRTAARLPSVMDQFEEQVALYAELLARKR